MDIQFDLPIVVTKELDLMNEFNGLTKEQLLQKKKELERENDEIQKEYVKVSDKYMKLRATKDAFLHVDCGVEYKIVDEKTYKPTGEEYLTLDMELQLVGRNMNSARERFELSKDELNALDRAILKQEIADYRKTAENLYQKFLDITNVQKVDEENTFIFVNKKQLLAFWDRRSNYTPDNYCIYGMVDVCDISEDDIKSASIISDGRRFYRGIKDDYSAKAIEYWTLDYSDVSLGKYMKPIQYFAVNLKEMLVGATCPVPTLYYEKREIMRKMIECVPSSVLSIPYEILADGDCLGIIIDALGVGVSKLFEACSVGASAMSKEELEEYKLELTNKLAEREKIASQKHKKS